LKYPLKIHFRPLQHVEERDLAREFRRSRFRKELVVGREKERALQHLAPPLDLLGLVDKASPTTVVAKPDLAHNYKVFVCDWKLKKGNFGDPNTDSRLVGTHFPHLRYHLFRFLALFFSDSDRKPSYDIILRGDVT